MAMHFGQSETQTDVVIVGGGLSGLTAACYLARANVPVTVFEKASSLGGRASTQAIGNYYFNQGIHAFYTGGAATRILKELGVQYSYGLPKNVAALSRGKLHPLPVDPLSFLRTGALSVGDKLALARFFTTLPRIDARTLGAVSVQKWLEQTIHRPGVRQLVAAFAHAYVYCAALDLVSADVFVEKLQLSLQHPIHYVDGGWQSLVDGLRQRAVEAGAQVVTGAHVEAIAEQDGRASGVHLRDGKLISASTVIVATRARDAVKLISEEASPSLHRAVDSLVPAQVACLDVALSRLPAARYPIVLDLDRPRFLSTQSLFSKVAPDGGALVYSFKQLDPARPSDPRTDERDLEDLLDVSLPGWRDVVVKRFYLPRIEAVGALPAVTTNGLAGRPAVDVAGLANLYLAGDWIGPEGFLIDGSMASAQEAAERVLRGRRSAVSGQLAYSAER